MFKATTAFILMAPCLLGQTGGSWSARQLALGPEPGSFNGCILTSAGDVDADGFADILVGAQWARPSGISAAGTVTVFSGATGALLHQFDGTLGQRLGHSIAGVGDVDLDGHDDILFNFANTGQEAEVALRSGVDGHLIYHLTGASGSGFGSQVLEVGDFNHDGVPDFLVSAHLMENPALQSMGQISIYSGSNGQVLHTIAAPTGFHDFGKHVAHGGDLDGDGIDDILVRCHDDVRHRIQTYSGTTLAPINRIAISFADWLDPQDISNAGDVDRDGVDDLLMASTILTLGGDPIEMGASLYSGADGHLMKLHIYTPTTFLAYQVHVLGNIDVNQDGYPDQIITRPDGGAIDIFSGKTGERVVSKVGDNRLIFNSEALQKIGDTDGDGYDEIAMCAPFAFNHPIGDLGVLFLVDFD